PGEDQHAHRHVIPRIEQRIAQFFYRFPVERIQHLRPVESDVRNPVLLLVDQILVCHSVFSAKKGLTSDANLHDIALSSCRGAAWLRHISARPNVISKLSIFDFRLPSFRLPTSNIEPLTSRTSSPWAFADPNNRKIPARSSAHSSPLEPYA